MPREALVGGIRAVLVGAAVLALAAGSGVSSASPGEGSSTTVSVRAFGARGDGMIDDTPAVQAAIDAAPEGALIYFPSGTYLVDNFQVRNRAGLRFEGDGAGSVIKRMGRPGNTRLATFIFSTDISIRHLVFDANGIERYGGVNFYSMKRVRIEQTRFFDSRRQPLGAEDRYPYVFGVGPIPSEDLWIENNQIEDLQLEVDHARRVHIIRNTVVRAARTAGIGIFTVADGSVAEDYDIVGNVVIDPVGTGIAVHLDPPRSSNATFSRIRIAENTVVRRATGGRAISIGTVDNSVATHGNRFEELIVEHNIVDFRESPPEPRRLEGLIFFNSSTRANLSFRRVLVKGNAISGNPHISGWAMSLNWLEDTMVEGNTVDRMRLGIALTRALNTTVRDNAASASDVAFHFSDSRGRNRIHGNHSLGNPVTAWQLVKTHPSDLIDQR